MNTLAREKSAYLRHSADQKVNWYPWSEQAFERAIAEDKPLFLSSGAVWCHWCHVMAKECFYDDDIAGLLNDNFVNIKLDRDERPDIDRRYQMAVAAMGSGGGWPLSVFLTPDKKPFYGGTYFPPEDRRGMPGFKKILTAVNTLYRSKRDEIDDYTLKLVKALEPVPASAGELSEDSLDQAVESVLSQFDHQNGGFGEAPKFPMPGATEFLINRCFIHRNKTVESAVRQTLNAMAGGGICDQIGGGFHRYSTDRAWIMPHFEKMADDNAWLLRNYISAYSLFGDSLFKEVAEGTIRFIRDVLSAPDGGFYASQDADVTPDDEGGYFTWTDSEFRNILNEEEYRVLSLYLLHDAGSMHHDKDKKVLFAATGTDEIAEKTGIGTSDIIDAIKTGRKKLLEARNRRKAPFIDKTLYTSINGMLISVFIHGFRALKDDDLKEFAIRSLDKIMGLRFLEGDLYHSDGIRALLDDYIYLIDALLSVYEVTGERSYLSRADEFMEKCIDKLWDGDGGGFFDTDNHLLGVKVKGIEDIPHPSVNAIGIMALLKLYYLLDKDTYRLFTEKALRYFSLKAGKLGIHTGYYFNALNAYFNALKLNVHTGPGSSLFEAAVTLMHPYSNIAHGEYKECVIPCMQGVCYEPINNPEKLIDFVNNIRYGRSGV